MTSESPSEKKRGLADALVLVTGLLVILLLLDTFGSSRYEEAHGMFSGGVGEGTPYYTTWNVILFLVALVTGGLAWWLKRRARANV